MPIDYKNYPANWKTEIRPAILERANNCCEFCAKNNLIVANYDVGFWDINDEWKGLDELDNSNLENKAGGLVRIIKIILTIAHLDHNIQNNSYDNLAALCQRCHNRLDVHDRVKNRKETRRIKSKQLSFI